MKEKGEEELIGVAQALNERMRQDESIYNEEPLRLVRIFPKPICVDFSYVLFDEQSWVPNPQAREALEVLRRVGTVCVVTTYREWEKLYEEFTNAGLWDSSMALITSRNYSRHSNPQAANEIISDYVRFMKEKGEEYPEEEFKWGDLYKRLAPIFRKPFKIPLIDDSPYVATRLPSTPDGVGMINHGMFTLWVKPFDSDPTQTPVVVDTFGHPLALGSLSLLEAEEEVRKYYSTI